VTEDREQEETEQRIGKQEEIEQRQGHRKRQNRG
jgi:hypothetical protein